MMNSFKELQLNNNQKFLVLNLADKNKNGRINIYEFVSFIRNFKNIDNSNLLLNRKNIIKKNELPQIQSIYNSMSMNSINNQSKLNEEEDEINTNSKNISIMPRV